jgi:adenylate cyclase, class 2
VRPILTSMQAAETELKFVVDDVASFHSSVEGLGLTLKTPRTFEGNTLFDTPDRKLRAKRQILRIREYGSKHVLTHKRLASEDASDSRYKVRIETETEVEDAAALAEVFCQLGYCPAFRYEKFRTEWDAAEGGHLVLDETPIGTWAELEGEPAWIEAMLARLHVASDRCTVESYGMLFLNWKTRTGNPAENLTFEEIGEPAIRA